MHHNEHVLGSLFLVFTFSGFDEEKILYRPGVRLLLRVAVSVCENTGKPAVVKIL